MGSPLAGNRQLISASADSNLRSDLDFRHLKGSLFRRFLNSNFRSQLYCTSNFKD